MRVASYNIHKGVLNDLFGLRRVATIHQLRQRLHDLDADLIFLQEVQGRNDRHARRFEQWPEESQTHFLSRGPSIKHTFESAYGKNAHYLHGHHGNALLSRYPIVRNENRDVSDHALEKRGILHVVVRIEERDVHCFVVHLGLFASSRQRQITALIEWIKRELPSDAPLLVAGDFNDWGHRLSESLYQQLAVREVFDEAPVSMAGKAGGHLRRAHAKVMSMTAPTVITEQSSQDRTSGEPLQQGANQFAQRMGAKFAHKLANKLANNLASRLPIPHGIRAARTYPSLIPWLKMDRIYQRGFTVQRAQVLRGPAWAQLSDHSPIIADLGLKSV